ncbi:MAG TPA: ATPase domain-containing protein [Acetobacteraceae bacterium]|nr:ATPase domain-containing protein [Acetobacteraceae bacterium]
MTDEADAVAVDRVPSGLPGLDEILRGGFFAGGIYVVRGAPGTGKTILANQACYRHAARGGKALYITLLAESHVRMLRNLARLSFFDPAAIPHGVYYVSALRALEDGGLSALMELIQAEVRRLAATLLVLDGLLATEEAGASDRILRGFMHALQEHLGPVGCVTLLLGDGGRPEYAGEHSMADGVIALDDTRRDGQAGRGLEVVKFRGSSSLRGRHSMRITDEGIIVYPRIETLHERPSRADESSNRRLSVGVRSLDTMLGGGLPAATTTLVLGASGTGKTMLGAHFLAGSSAAEPGLHFGFYEHPERLAQNAASVGLDLAGPASRGDLELLWYPTAGQILDDLGEQLLKAVGRRGVKRLLVDGLGGYVEAADDPARAGKVFAVLVHELRAQGVTTVYTAETPNLVGTEVVVPVPGVSVVVDNMVLLRFAEYRARLHRLFSIIKVRGSTFDPGMREFRITDKGITLADTVPGPGHPDRLLYREG